MKREAMGHRKLKKLCFRLQVPTYVGVGILESLWHLASREAPAGDIGKMSDDDIAFAIDYRQSAEELIGALVYAELVDRDLMHRLLVHDWPDHCEDSIHARLARAGIRFANGAVPNFKKLSKSERAQAERVFERQPTVANGSQIQETAADGGQNGETAADGSRRLPNEQNGGLPCLAPPRHAPPCPADRSIGSPQSLRDSAAADEPADRSTETASGMNPAGQTLELVRDDGESAASGFPRARGAIAAYFPAADDAIVARVVQAARKRAPDLRDDELAILIHAVVPDTGDHRPRGPAWFERVVGEFVEKRSGDVRLIEGFARGEIPREEASAILADGKADGRVCKALRVWMGGPP